MACERDDELGLSLSLQFSADHNPKHPPSPSPFPLNLFTSPSGGLSQSDDRKRLRLSKEQTAVLEESFKKQNSVTPRQQMALAKQLNLRPRQVEVWFQNTRARNKLKQKELESEYMRRCYENLTEENRRLKKEVNELKLYTNMSPPTTLKICPQCERQTPPTAPPPPPRILYETSLNLRS